jgi:IS5 family transposase
VVQHVCAFDPLFVLLVRPCRAPHSAHSPAVLSRASKDKPLNQLQRTGSIRIANKRTRGKRVEKDSGAVISVARCLVIRIASLACACTPLSAE